MDGNSKWIFILIRTYNHHSLDSLCGWEFKYVSDSVIISKNSDHHKMQDSLRYMTLWIALLICLAYSICTQLMLALHFCHWFQFQYIERIIDNTICGIIIFIKYININKLYTLQEASQPDSHLYLGIWLKKINQKPKKLIAPTTWS